MMSELSVSAAGLESRRISGLPGLYQYVPGFEPPARAKAIQPFQYDAAYSDVAFLETAVTLASTPVATL